MSQNKTVSNLVKRVKAVCDEYKNGFKAFGAYEDVIELCDALERAEAELAKRESQYKAVIVELQADLDFAKQQWEMGGKLYGEYRGKCADLTEKLERAEAENDDLARIVTETKKRSSDRAIEIETLTEKLSRAMEALELVEEHVRNIALDNGKGELFYDTCDVDLVSYCGCTIMLIKGVLADLRGEK